MAQIGRFYLQIKAAWSSGIFWDKVSRFLVSMVRTPFEVMMGYICLSKVDRNLNVKDGFADHRLSEYHRASNPKDLRRIIAAYEAAKQAQPQAALPFKIRGRWDDYVTVYSKKFIPAFEEENISGFSCLLENLFREPFTNGMGGYEDYVRYRNPGGGFYVKYVWSTYRSKLLTLDFDLQKLDFPPIGNPIGILFNGNVISIETLRHAYHAVEMCQLLRNVPKASIVEIGGGLGGQAYQTMRMMGEQVRQYVIFDIPEVVAISSYFLLSAFPNRRVRLFGEGSVSVDSSEEYDLGVFPHFAITQLPDSSVDLFYNSCSFSEMDGATSREYLSVIERTCRKYFLHDNHDMVQEYRTPDGSTSVNVIGSKLIPNSALFKRIFKKPRVHGLPSDRSTVQFEYLYERI